MRLVFGATDLGLNSEGEAHSTTRLYRLLQPGRIGENEFPHAPTLRCPHSDGLFVLIRLTNRNVGSDFPCQPHVLFAAIGCNWVWDARDDAASTEISVIPLFGCPQEDCL